MGTSKILKFYENTNVFITGGTGFLGKILIEKLLRSTAVSTLFILIRAKKGKDAETRKKELFDDVVFERLYTECPKFMERVVVINGDVSFPELGISQKEKEILFEKVGIIFHAAATVRFDENLKLAYKVNIKGAQAVMDLGRRMPNLKSLVHVSTAFSNCNLEEIEEKIYDNPICYEEVGKILENLSESQADKYTSRIIGSWPNTYTFTKALAESMIIENTDDNMPVGIFRPAIVISTFKEPIKGWIDNLYGPTGVCAGVSTGFIRVLYCNKDKKAELVPVDMCVAALIASAWEIGEKYEKLKISKSTEKNEIPVYNFVSADNSLTWKEFCTLNVLYGHEFPPNRIIWTYTLNLTNNPYLYLFMKIVFHFLPAILFDVVGMLFFKNPGLLGMYRKIHKFSNVLEFFTTRQWKFTNTNIVNLWSRLDEDEKQLFYFDMGSLDWWAYYKNYLCGIRKYILKDKDDTLNAAKKRIKMFDYLHKIVLICVNFVLSVMAWTFIQKILFGSRLCVQGFPK